MMCLQALAKGFRFECALQPAIASYWREILPGDS